MGFLKTLIRKARELAEDIFEQEKPEELKKDIRMFSGCMDSQTSADVSDVKAYGLPDVAGAAGGACTSAMLHVLYKDEEVVVEDLTFQEVLMRMRDLLESKNFTQIPQLSSSNVIDIHSKFDLVPDNSTGTRRALMIGINYTGQDPGELSGCHNDVKQMKNYITKIHGFEEENITLLLDDGEHTTPNKKNMLAAYKKIVDESSEGDAIYLHFSGHGVNLPDDNGDEEDGYDEALVPVDYKSSGFIRDDDLYDIVVKGLPDGVSVVALMDCCHSGTILDLPYVFKADGTFERMRL